MFKTPLTVEHVTKEDWRLTRPLLVKGTFEYIIVPTGFITNFASIPKPVRWLLDNAGRNSEAAVLHDAAWRDSKLPDAQVDPWHVDGMFRRGLRATGSPALTRALMWFAVRLVAMLSGRVGRAGPGLLKKILLLVAVFVLGLVFAAGPTVVAVAGLLVYGVGNWLVAAAWWPAERRSRRPTNWPWPIDSLAKRSGEPPPAPVRMILVRRTVDPYTKGAPAPTPHDLARAAAIDALLASGEAITDEALATALEAVP